MPGNQVPKFPALLISAEGRTDQYLPPLKFLSFQAALGRFSSPLPSPSESSSPGCDMLGSLLRASPQPLPMGQITPSPSQMGQITPSPGLLRYLLRHSLCAIYHRKLGKVSILQRSYAKTTKSDLLVNFEIVIFNSVSTCPPQDRSPTPPTLDQLGLKCRALLIILCQDLISTPISPILT